MKEIIKKVLINTFAFILAIWITVWIVYAANLTSTNQKAFSWDIITAEWINDVNDKLKSKIFNTSISSVESYNSAWCKINNLSAWYLPASTAAAHRYCKAKWYSTWLIAEVYLPKPTMDVACIN